MFNLTTKPVSAGKLKVVKLNSNVSIVPKQWLLEFMLIDDFIYNYPKGSKLKPILNQVIIKRWLLGNFLCKKFR